MNVGRIELIFGPMFAGKTTEMLRRISRGELAHKRCLILKYSKDQRYSSEKVSTHDYYMHDALSTALLMPHLQECMAYEVIGVDEGQFFPDIVEFADTLANSGKLVVISALDGDYLRKPFGKVGELIAKSETVVKLSAVCRVTGQEAAFTERTIKSDQLELIGGAEAYTASSRSAHKKITTTGSISLTIGPVKCGKTTEITRLLKRHHIAGRKVLMLIRKADKDRTFPFETKNIKELPDYSELEPYEVIGVDDGHLFENIAEWADGLADRNKKVMVAAADGDVHQNAFPNILKLFSFSEEVHKIDSVCPITGLPAPFTTLFNDSVYLPISRLGIINQRALYSVLNNF